jgi:hypothetical protein
MTMDPERIEKILKEHFPQGEPEGARGRILARAAREVRPARARVTIFIKWAFAATAIAIILLANVSDHARQTRFAWAMGGGLKQSPTFSSPAIASMDWRWRTRDALIPEELGQVERKGEKPL